jgi:hypothetical protein
VVLGDDPGKAAGPESSRLVGKLVLNTSGDSHAPPYCVLDHWGKVVGEVSPAAGLELGAYCNRTVTLVGTMAAMPKDAPPHLVATRVLGADLRFHLPTADHAALQDGQPPVRPVAYQEPNAEVLSPGNAQTKPDNAPSAGQKSLLRQPQQDNGQSMPPAAPQTPAPVTEPGPLPLTAQPAPSFDAGEPACGACDFCCPRRSRVFGQVDYLIWWTEGMAVPPLVTEGNADVNPGRLNTPGTTILFGGDNILDGSRSGGRAEIGYWFNDCHTSGIEGEYLGLEDGNDDFRIWSPGTPVISRPFFDLAGNPRVELVAYPVTGPLAPPIAGSVSVNARTDFQTAALRGRWEWFGEGSFCEPGDCSLCQCGRRVDITLGYRYLQLNDNLGIREELTTTNYGDADPNANGSFLLQDSFATRNQFHGGELGLDFQTRRGRWTFEVDPKIALGSNQETVVINGSTTITNAAGVATTYPGGLLALTSNIGQYQRNVFAVVPQASFKLGYQLTPRLRVTTAYDFLYWSRVVRAGNQIDLTVDEAGIAPPTGTPTRPTFAFQESGFWAQGFSFGLDYGW